MGQRDDLVAAKSLHHAGCALGLDADDLAGGLQLLDSVADAGDKTAAANGGDDDIHVLQLIEDLKADGTLSCHDGGIVKGMDEGIVMLVTETDGLGVGIVIDTGNEDNLCAVAAGGLNFGKGCAFGDADDGMDAHVAGGESHALCVVAGRAGNDATALLLLGQGGDLIVSTTELKCARFLQTLGL